MKAVKNCVDVPKEVCVRVRRNPRKIKKPIIKKWCYVPSEETGLDNDNDTDDETSTDTTDAGEDATEAPVAGDINADADTDADGGLTSPPRRRNRN